MIDYDQYEVVIGLEVHAQLLTNTKLFCGDTTDFGKSPNTQVSVISLGHPGTLPKLNKEAIQLAIRLGISTNCEITEQNYFARKNYFYPDLPKGYQISQHTTPICKSGFLEINTGTETRRIRLNRIHIEEDAGKSMHDEASDFSNIDYNRAGMPLVEIVTEPDIRSADEAAAYVSTLRRLVRHLEVCDGNMEKGSLRCDVNISVRKKGITELGTRVEIKNLNSIKFIKKAVEFESRNLIEQVERCEKILQKTKGFDEVSSTTYDIRTKEDEDDYRYFPEPDLPPFFISTTLINEIKSKLPPTQEETVQQLKVSFELSEYDAKAIANDSDLNSFYLQLTAGTKNYKAAANWVVGPIKNYLSHNDIILEDLPLTPASVVTIIEAIDEGLITYGIATQNIFPQLINNPSMNIREYIHQNNLKIQSADESEEYIDAALQKHADKIEQYKKGKKGLLSVFVGEVMKLSRGKADAKAITEKILEKLKD